MAILIKNARVFAPKDLGVVDVLMANERILAVGKDLAPNLPDLQTVEAGGMIMTPGFFDQHIHVTGGGGEGGPATRTPELVLSELVACGTTDVVGVSVTDYTTRSIPNLLAKVREMCIRDSALMCPADLLLLDEPTNHLDIDSLIWLENWLRRVEATVVIISHDREFLDRAVTTIWSVEDDTVCRYAGNYSAFESQRIEKLRLQDAAAKAYEREASHLSSFIERFRAKATKARQAQSRIKMLEKLKAVEPVRAKREWRFEFPKPVRLPEHLVDTENLRLGYDERVVIDRVTLSIRSGERIGILGVNGAGKSTLVKGIVGDLAPMAGELRRGQEMCIRDRRLVGRHHDGRDAREVGLVEVDDDAFGLEGVQRAGRRCNVVSAHVGLRTGGKGVVGRKDPWS